MSQRELTGFEVAVIGLAGRFPGADSVQALWHNLVHGIEGIRRLSDDELRALGRSDAELSDPAWVPVHGVLAGHDRFDAEFFGIRGREAEVLDPQHRLFLEVAWQALEDAGIDTSRDRQTIGVFAGSSADHYLYDNLRRNPAAMARAGEFLAAYSNLPDHLAPRVSYKLDLTGPSVVVQTACSTSLVAVHLACQQLITGGCDVALAGGVSLTLPQHWGYRYEEGMIMSPDGRCRAFDAQAQGCLKGDGVGVVVLKRLSDALADGDRIDAVILGSATNNDGAAKVGYTAPGLDGQVRVIEAAQAMAGVSPDDIGYIEGHGTATPLGDPIEIGALTQVFRRHTQRVGFCGIGSIKTGIGHLDAAAGVAGLIKAVLALKHRTLPASLHFQRPNPDLQLEQSPFEVVSATRPWVGGAAPRRAGVSSFGIGGSNAHVVLQEGPVTAAGQIVAGPVASEPQLLVLSARSPQALDAMVQALAERLLADDAPALDAAAATLLHGRRAFNHRRAVVASSAAEAAALLLSPAAGARGSVSVPPSVVFLFPGQGAQYVNMARGLYDHEPAFRALFDELAKHLLERAGLDLLPVLYPTIVEAGESAQAERLKQTDLAQPALFVIEYTLARWLIDRGVEPAAMVGHSLGEWTAACLAGVFTLDDALDLVVLRGRLMQAQPPGAMLAVPLPRAELAALLGADLSLAAENAPGLCVVAGPFAAVDALARRLADELAVDCTPLHTSHAFHSVMMAGAVAPFVEALSRITLQRPRRRWISTVTGRWVEEAEVVDPAYWARNLRDTVQFAAAAKLALTLDNVVLLEVGPGATLSSLARRAPGARPELACITTLRLAREAVDDQAHLQQALGRLWVAGQVLQPAPDARRQRVALPTYPFQRERFWIDPEPLQSTSPAVPPATAHKLASPGVHYHVPSWMRSALSAVAAASAPGRWWLVAQSPVEVQPVLEGLRELGASFRVLGIDAAAALGTALDGDEPPDHLIFIAPPSADGGFDALLPLCRAVALRPGATPLSLNVVAESAWQVIGDEPLRAERVLPVGLTQVLPVEAEGVLARFVDIQRSDPAWGRQVVAEARAAAVEGVVAYRRGHRWRRTVEAVHLPALPASTVWRAGAVTLLTGGLGAMALALAEHIARQTRGTLVLVSRTALPPRSSWAAWPTPADRIGGILSRLLAIEALGARVITEVADVADESAVRALHHRVGQAVGAVHGIVHAAGLAGGRALGLMSRADVEAVFAAKVQGTQVLLDAFADEPLDFVVLCSSLTSVVARAGRAEYTAANLYLDAVATADARARVISINWDNWVEAGMAHDASMRPLQGLSHAQGVAAFDQALAQGWPQLLVSSFDLQSPPATGPEPASVATASAAAETNPSEPPLAAVVGPAGRDAPRSETERKLVTIWQDLLGVPVVGIHDNFFELGGDSVVSIQLTSRARRAGLALQARHIFEHKTIAELAIVLGDGTTTLQPPVPVVTAATTGLALLPIQRWFFNLPLQNPAHWNLSAWFDVSPAFDGDAVATALAAVLARHDACRWRFAPTSAGWQAQIGPVEPLRFERWAPGQADAGEARLQAGLNLTQGPLFCAAWIDPQASIPGRLLLVAHHLVADVMALRTLADELSQALGQLSHGEAIALDAPGTSLQAWSQALVRHAASPAVQSEAPLWHALAQRPWRPLPRDYAAGVNTAGSAATLTTALDEASTRSLLQWATQGGGAADMLGALAAALARALMADGADQGLWLDLEDHGRAPFDDHLDPSRTVGWLTTLYPVVVQADGSARAAADEAIRQLRALPQRGAGHGQLRYLAGDAVLAAAPQPEVVLLYQGQLRPSAADGLVRLAQMGSPWCRDPADLRSHLLELNARVEDGQLRVDWGYTRALHDDTTVARWAELFHQALREVVAPLAEALPTPMPLSFAQERLWFLQQINPDANILNKQAVIELVGQLDIPALQAAFSALTVRHDTLRTRFVVIGGEPRQCVDAPRPVVIEPRAVAGDDEAQRLCRDWVSAAFDLAGAPALRVGLLRFSAQRHWLVISLHHIVSDAWSFQVLLRELALLYAAQLHAARTTPLAPLPSRFADHALAQRQRMQGQVLDELLAYWRERLAGIEPLELPTDRPRPPVQQYAGGRVPFQWPVALTQALRAQARQAGASVFMSLLGLYSLLLYRYSGQSDIVVGSTAIDRPQVDTEGFIAPMINNLVLRTDLSGNPGFAALLARVRETVLSADEHRALPFEKLVEALAPRRDRSRSPLFQAMITFMNVPPALAQWPGLQVSARELDSHNAEFDLTLYAYDPGTAPDGTVSGWIEYSTALFDHATIERMAGHLQALAQAVADDAVGGIDQLQMLTTAEQAALRAHWLRPPEGTPFVAGIHRLVADQAARTPDAVALECDDASLSYQELDRRSNQLARHLQSLGVGTGADGHRSEDYVVICADRSSAMVIGLLAILKAGGAYVSVDPLYPADRVAFMTQDCQAKVVLTQGNLAARMPAEVPQVLLDADWPAITQHSTDDLGIAARPDQLAIVIYTSGSTGRPKGVQLEHAAVVNLLQAMRDWPGIGAGDRLLAVSSISFDLHILEIFLPLISGATAVLAGRDVTTDPPRLAQMIADRRITLMEAVPTLWRMLVESGWAGQPGLKILSGGEPMPVTLAEALLSRCAELWNLYGPTETTVYTTGNRLFSATELITVGHCIANLRAVVLDRQGQPLPVGIPGELWFGGVGLARGYLNRPELTAERFRPDPLGGQGRIYGTGDLVRQLDDGRYEVLGRLDHQVKLRGHRIELGEIEHAVASHPAVSRCVAMVREDQPGDQRLVVYVMPREPGMALPSLPELREHAGRGLPDYMLPAAMVALPDFPLTPNRKIDRKALPPPPRVLPVAVEATMDEDRTDAERLVASIFAEVLGREQVNLEDNFFDLGGHSLLTMKVVERFQQATGLRMRPGELFQQSVGQIAAYYAPKISPAVDDKVAVAVDPSDAGMPPVDRPRGLTARLGNAFRQFIRKDMPP